MEEFKLKYYLVYFLVALFSLIIATQEDVKNNRVSNKLSNKLLFVAAVAFIILYSLRGTNIGDDTSSYLYTFNDYASFSFNSSIFLYYIFKTLHQFDLQFQFFLLMMSVLFIGILSVSIIRNGKIFKSNPLLIFFSFISMFYFQSLGINIIKQGVSISFLLLAIVNYQLFRNKKLLWIIPFILSILFHFTSAIAVFSYICILYFKNVKTKSYYLFYLGCLVLSLLSISFLNVKDYLSFLIIDTNKAEGYLSGVDEVYTIGFKTQFVAFNTVFLLLFIYIKSYVVQNSYYDNVLKYYLVLSGVFFLTFQIAYSDRWGLFSWIVIPVLVAPIFSSNFPKKIQTITCLGFILIFVFFENLS
jgi:hypothetical protein